MDPMALYQQAVDKTGRLIAGVKPDQKGDPTPCTKYDVRELINHTIGANYFFVAVQRGESMDPEAPTPDPAGDNPAGAYSESAKAIMQMWQTPGVMEQTFNLGPMSMPGSQAVGIAMMETAIHGWDLAKATGQDTTIDPAIAGAIYEGMKGFIPSEMRGEDNMFAPEVKVPDDAPVQDKLLGYLGRQP